MTLERRFVADCTADTVARALTHCFEGYVVPMRLTGEQFERRFRSEHLDPYASTVWFDRETPAAIALICRRGWTCRLAAFGVATSLRSKGLSKTAMGLVIAEAKARRELRMVLEVIEGNDRAMRLYESLGFTKVRRLVGYDRVMPSAAQPDTSLREVDPAEAAALMSRFADDNLSWQLQPDCFYGLALPTRAFVLDDAAVAFVEAGAQSVRLRGLAVDPKRRRQGLGRRMLEALSHAVPAERLSIPAIAPERLAQPFLTRTGWQLSSLSQQEMTLDLSRA